MTKETRKNGMTMITNSNGLMCPWGKGYGKE